MAQTISIYGNAQNFLSQFAPQTLGKYMTYGRDKLITAQKPPTLTIAKEAYGEASVKLFLKQQIVQLADYFGVGATESQVDNIAEVLIYKAGDLKMTEMMLFFLMMKEGSFREGLGDRAKMYGQLSGEVITDCLYFFRNDYRSRVIDHYEDEQRKKRKEEEELNASSYEDRRKIIARVCIADNHMLDLAKKSEWLNEEDMRELESFIKELNTLRLFKQRVESALEARDSGRDNTTELDKVRKGIKYLNENFPNETEFDNK